MVLGIPSMIDILWRVQNELEPPVNVIWLQYDCRSSYIYEVTSSSQRLNLNPRIKSLAVPDLPLP